MIYFLILINNYIQLTKSISDFEERCKIPKDTIIKTVVNGGDVGAWARLERGELTMPEFFKVFNDECSQMVSIY